jgi:hypothetical protein
VGAQALQDFEIFFEIFIDKIKIAVYTIYVELEVHFQGLLPAQGWALPMSPRGVEWVMLYDGYQEV